MTIMPGPALASQLRHAHAGVGIRHPNHPGAARPSGSHHHDDLYSRHDHRQQGSPEPFGPGRVRPQRGQRRAASQGIHNWAGKPHVPPIPMASHRDKLFNHGKRHSTSRPVSRNPSGRPEHFSQGQYPWRVMLTKVFGGRNAETSTASDRARLDRVVVGRHR